METRGYVATHQTASFRTIAIVLQGMNRQERNYKVRKQVTFINPSAELTFSCFETEYFWIEIENNLQYDYMQPFEAQEVVDRWRFTIHFLDGCSFKTRKKARITLYLSSSLHSIEFKLKYTNSTRAHKCQYRAFLISVMKHVMVM